MQNPICGGPAKPAYHLQTADGLWHRGDVIAVSASLAISIRLCLSFMVALAQAMAERVGLYIESPVLVTAVEQRLRGVCEGFYPSPAQ